MHRKVAAALLAALALGATACGGSEEQLTRAQLTSRIQAACRQIQERMQNAGGSADFLATALEAQRQLQKRVEGLEGSDELNDVLTKLEGGLAERNAAIARVVDAPRAEQGRAMRAINAELSTSSRTIETAFRELNVRDCG